MTCVSHTPIFTDSTRMRVAEMSTTGCLLEPAMTRLSTRGQRVLTDGYGSGQRLASSDDRQDRRGSRERARSRGHLRELRSNEASNKRPGGLTIGAEGVVRLDNGRMG